MNPNTIHEVLCAVDYGAIMRKKIDHAFAPAIVHHVEWGDKEAIEEVIHSVDVAVLPNDLDDHILKGEKLRWIHCCHAGLTKSAREEVFKRDILLTGAAGRSALSLAEHVFFFALALTYDAYRLKDAQELHDWTRIAHQYANTRGLNGKTMGIIGLGHTGREVALRAKAFDMRVLAYSRRARVHRPENVDAYYAQEAGESIGLLLRDSDYVVLCCHLSDATYHLITSYELSRMKPTAFLINMARGPVVDQTALREALQRNVIAGAGCDVFDVEPLPTDDPIWDVPNLIITPHATPHVPDVAGNSTSTLFENIERYRKGTEMINRLTIRDIYTR